MKPSPAAISPAPASSNSQTPKPSASWFDTMPRATSGAIETIADLSMTTSSAATIAAPPVTSIGIRSGLPDQATHPSHSAATGAAKRRNSRLLIVSNPDLPSPIMRAACAAMLRSSIAPPSPISVAPVIGRGKASASKKQAASTTSASGAASDRVNMSPTRAPPGDADSPDRSTLMLPSAASAAPLTG